VDLKSIRKKILSANDEVARATRERFGDDGTLVVDVVSSPGSGKTTLIAETAPHLADLRAGAIVGDIATELDADRLRAAGLPAHQIVTGGACHLDARMLADALPVAGLGELDLLFVENVGNLVCPASWDLGEDLKVVLLSVPEGPDKPFKYPAIFARAEITLITKIDLLAHFDFDLERVREQIHTLNPGARILEVSTVTGEGIEAWCSLLTTRLAAKRPQTLPV